MDEKFYIPLKKEDNPYSLWKTLNLTHKRKKTLVPFPTMNKTTVQEL